MHVIQMQAERINDASDTKRDMLHGVNNEGLYEAHKSLTMVMAKSMRMKVNQKYFKCMLFHPLLRRTVYAWGDRAAYTPVTIMSAYSD